MSRLRLHADESIHFLLCVLGDVAELVVFVAKIVVFGA